MKRSFGLMVLASVITMGSAVAQTYPSKPIQLIAPFGPGGDADLSARNLAAAAQAHLSQPMVVMNRAGAGGTVAEFEAQLKATSMFYKAAEAASFAKTPKLKETMEFVRTFSFEKGLFGKGARTKDAVGIGFADGSTLGNAKNVKLRFDATYMQLAADGKL